jgi:eukaryotic-like serine/threonine-protein kinase
MGQVYLAEHIHLHRRVAIKVLPAKLASDQSGVQRFYREARAVAALDHPNVVRAYDVAFESNAHFLVLEYIQGQTLEDLLAEAGSRLPVNVACDYVAQAAAGLQHAHEKGISHRDIKPANLLVNPEGIVKILDMGLAKFFQSNSQAETPDKATVMGTADYIAPEQAIACSASDHRADIYSLGATLYHLVTGEPPFHGNLAAKLIAHQLHDVPTAHEVREDVPEGVSDIIAKMMAKEPADRYQTAADVAEALLPYLDDQPLESSTAPEQPNGSVIAVPHPNPHKRLILALWLGIILLSAVICVMLLR